MVTWFNPKTDSSIRIPVSVVVQVESGGEKSYFLFSQNISMTGIYLESERLLEPGVVKMGNLLNLLFYLPSSRGEPIQVSSKVVRVEEIRSFKGDRVHAIALEFLDLSGADQDRLRLFMADYEVAMENSVTADEVDKSEEEITDPQTVVQPLKDVKTGAELFQPLSLDDYQQLYSRSKEIQADLREQKPVKMTPLQLLAIETLDQMADIEKAHIESFYKQENSTLKHKTLLNLCLLRIKISIELQLLKAIISKIELTDYTKQYLGNYFTSVCYESDQLNEAAHFVAQKLVSEENWDDFKLVNHKRADLEAAIRDLRNDLEPYAIFAKDEEVSSAPVIERLSIDSCLKDIEEIIPDPADERDLYANGASGDDVRQLWETTFALKDELLKSKLHLGLALRRRVRTSFIKCQKLGEDILNHRQEVTAIFREDSKAVKELVADLMLLSQTHPAERESITLMMRLLEGLAFEFGKLVRTIPRRLLTTEEIDSVRFRTSTFRKKHLQLATIKRFTRKYAIKVALVAMLIFTVSYHLKEGWHRRSRQLPINLIDNLGVLKSIIESNGCLYLTVKRQQWLFLSFAEQRQRLQTIVKTINDENAKSFKLNDEHGMLLAFGQRGRGHHEFATFLTFREPVKK